MAEYTAIAPQVVAVNSNVLFTETAVSGGCVSHREGSGVFTLHGGKRYLVTFGANISGATAGTAVALAIAIAGEPLGSATMIATPSAADALNNVSASVYIRVPPCCCYNVSVENVGTTEVTVQNANLIVTKEG